jgi:hypothetical protein
VQSEGEPDGEEVPVLHWQAAEPAVLPELRGQGRHALEEFAPLVAA